MSGGHTLSVLLQNELVILNRAFGMLRRRNLSIKSIAVGPSASPGLARLTIMMQTDQATADRTAKQLDKVVGVREVAAFPSPEGVTRELALVKVRPGEARSRAEAAAVSLLVIHESAHRVAQLVLHSDLLPVQVGPQADAGL